MELNTRPKAEILEWYKEATAESLKREGMENAARRRKECLAACRHHLVQLAIMGDNTVTADDAQQYIQQNNLEPLGNAAGSLFMGKHWRKTGEYRQSLRKSNHAHSNPVWEFLPEFYDEK